MLKLIFQWFYSRLYTSVWVAHHPNARGVLFESQSSLTVSFVLALVRNIITDQYNLGNGLKEL